MERTQVLAITRKFSDDDWSEFVRAKLNLDDETIEEIEDSRASRPEKKYRAVIKWMKSIEESNDLEKLCKLSGLTVETKSAEENGTNTARAFSAKNSSKKGYALIISNGFEDDPILKREKASEKDLKLMKNLWETELGCRLYEDKVHKNLSVEEMKRKLVDFAKVRRECDYLVVYISTHGDTVAVSKNGGIETYAAGFYGNDMKPVSEEELMYYFQNNRSVYEGVTKFFILDYSHDANKRLKAGPIEKSPNRYKTRSLLPLLSDIVTIHATEQESENSLLTTTLHSVFKENWKTHSLTKMLMMVNKRMREDGKGSMSIFESSLVNDFTFYQQ